MVVHECAFDPIKDKQAVEPFGFIDLQESFVSGVVPSQLPDSEANYNGIEKPDSILGKPEDVFEAMHMEAAINAYQPDPSGDKSEE